MPLPSLGDINDMLKMKDVLGQKLDVATAAIDRLTRAVESLERSITDQTEALRRR